MVPNVCEGGLSDAEATEVCSVGAWWQQTQAAFPQVRTRVLDLAKGPENHGYRRQCLYRLVGVAQKQPVTLRLAYYPPYHSKDHPSERCGGILANYWRGERLDSEAAVLGYAGQLTYNGKRPAVHRVTKTYSKGVRGTKAEKKQLEQQLQRWPALARWVVAIPPANPDEPVL